MSRSSSSASTLPPVSLSLPLLSRFLLLLSATQAAQRERDSSLHLHAKPASFSASFSLSLRSVSRRASGYRVLGSLRRTTAATMVAKDEWVKTAMAEDGMVAELLVRLKQEPRCAPAPPHPHPPSSSAAAAAVASASGSPLPPPRWGIRQPRSRIAFRCDAGSPAKRCGDSARNSPTTPLSWSAASSSGTADGVCDDSNLQFCGSSSTSKVIASSDSGTPDLKKSRKRKTFAELKEEEGLLLKGRVHLNKEIATLRATFKEQSTRNESLKKMKHDVDMNTTKITTISVTCEPEKANSNAHGVEAPSTVDHAASTLPTHVASPSRSSDSQQRCGSPEKQSASFLLPDLNMMPSEDDPLSEALKGMSSGETLETLQ